MRFRKLSYHNPNDPQGPRFVNARLEYFHHTWTFLMMEKQRWIFFNDERWESHRSLSTKIEIQLTQNKEHYPKRVRSLVLNHPYFSNKNLFVRKSSALLKRLKAFRTNFIASFSKADLDKGSKHLSKIKKDISAIEKLILGKTHTHYFDKVMNHLVQVIHNNKPLTKQDKSDLHFLINAAIVELYHFGYSIEYIRKLPDIILFYKTHQEDFPFDKEYSDFNDDNLYKAYKDKVIASMTLRQQLISLLNLGTHPKRKGYFVLKIDNFIFQEKKPSEIWGVTFYNPQLQLKLNYGGKKELNDYVESIERYFERYVEKEEDKQRLRSNCNAIVATEYRPQYFNHVDPSIIRSIDSVKRSLSVLKHLKHLHVGGNSFYATVNLQTVIVTDADLNYRAAPAILQDYGDEKPFVVKERATKSINESLKWAHKLNPDNEFHRKVIDINFTVNQYRHDPFSFSFKDFWIIVSDPLFPNDPKGFIEFCCRCVALYLKNQYVANVKIFLRDALKAEGFSNGNYTLSKSKMNALRMDIFLYKPIKARGFLKQYPKITQWLTFDFLTDVIEDLDDFMKNQPKYMDKIKGRLTEMIYEVYAERNLEVHNNLVTDLSMIKLREFCVALAVILQGVITQKIKPKTRSVDELKI